MSYVLIIVGLLILFAFIQTKKFWKERDEFHSRMKVGDLVYILEDRGKIPGRITKLNEDGSVVVEVHVFNKNIIIERK